MKCYLDYLKNLVNFKDPIDERTYKKYTVCMLITFLIIAIALVFFVMKLPEIDFYTHNQSSETMNRNLSRNLVIDLIYIGIIIIFYFLQISMEIRRYITRNKSPRLFISLMLTIIFIYLFIAFFDYYRGHLVRHDFLALFMWIPLVLTDSNRIFKRSNKGEA